MNFQQFFIQKFFSIKGRKNLFSFNSIISIVGITIGVIALTVSLALFSGYQKLIKDIILGVNSHIYISKFGGKTIDEKELTSISSLLDTMKAVQSYAPFIYTEGMALNNKKIGGIILRGVDYESENQTTKFKEFISQGTFISDGKNVVVGKNLAKRLNVKVGDSIKLITPLNAEYTVAGMIPQKLKVTISGIFFSGMFDYDNSLVFLNMKETQQFLNMPGQYSGISVRLINDEIEKASIYSSKLLDKIQYPFNVTDWIILNRNLFSLLKLEKWVIFLIIGLIILVAGFGMTSVLSMHIFDKRKEIGILKAIGAENATIQRIFLYRNIILGFTGVILGMILGIILSQILTFTDIVKIESDVYMVDRLIVKNNLIDFVFIIIVSGVIVLGSAYFPLRKIAKMDAVSIIRTTKK